jgi:hypothetical protein
VTRKSILMLRHSSLNVSLKTALLIRKLEIHGILSLALAGGASVSGLLSTVSKLIYSSSDALESVLAATWLSVPSG